LINFKDTYDYLCIDCSFEYSFRRRMWWLFLVLQITAIDVGIWLPFWKLGKIWIRIFCSLIQLRGKLSLTLHERHRIIFCNFIYLFVCSYTSFCCYCRFVFKKRGVSLFKWWRIIIIINIILSFWSLSSAAAAVLFGKETNRIDTIGIVYFW
jgi:hypothetical protein